MRVNRPQGWLASLHAAAVAWVHPARGRPRACSGARVEQMRSAGAQQALPRNARAACRHGCNPYVLTPPLQAGKKSDGSDLPEARFFSPALYQDDLFLRRWAAPPPRVFRVGVLRRAASSGWQGANMPAVASACCVLVCRPKVHMPSHTHARHALAARAAGCS